MNQRTRYLIQILDKIGAPLLSAAQHVNNDAETAQTVAGLLGKVVETSISMNQALDLTAEDAQDDSLRIALAALAGSIVSDQYKQKGKVPEAADLSRIQSAMSAVLTFGDNFTLSPEHVARLEKLNADGSLVDAHQISIQYVDALIPVINAVGAFPFGQPEQKLIMDVSDRLVKRTAEMRETLLPGLSGDDEKLAELAILRATASIYADCHENETKRLTGTDTETPDSLSITPVWEAFETRTAMLEAVVKNIMPEGAITSAPVVPVPPPLSQAEPPPAPPPVQEQPASPPPPPLTPPPVEPPPAPPAEPVAQPEQTAPPPVAPPPPPPVETQTAATDAPAGASPMGFFAKPKDGGEPPPEDSSISPPLAQPEPPPAPPPVQEQPATPPPPPVEPPPAPPAEPVAQPEQQAASEEDNGGDSNQSGGNPMSFFSKKE